MRAVLGSGTVCVIRIRRRVKGTKSKTVVVSRILLHRQTMIEQYLATVLIIRKKINSDLLQTNQWLWCVEEKTGNRLRNQWCRVLLHKSLTRSRQLE